MFQYLEKADDLMPDKVKKKVMILKPAVMIEDIDSITSSMMIKLFINAGQRTPIKCNY